MIVTAKQCSVCGTKNPNPKRKTSVGKVITGMIILLIGCQLYQGALESAVSTSTPTSTPTTNTSTTVNKTKVHVIDFSNMEKNEIELWGKNNSVNISIQREYSDVIASGNFISQSTPSGENTYEGDKITIVYSMGEEPSIEYKNALNKAEIYADMMYMSKKGIYEQLSSSYGDKFDDDAAQYAIDNVNADWNNNALNKAITYSDMMYMSKQNIYDQLCSSHGDKFTNEEAQYAIDNIEADWNFNALETAKTYQEMMSMSKNAIYDQLVSSYGNNFTVEQAQYAIDNLSS